ncbi:MAG: molybdate ABC transporter substrate-binding protein [Planctomycetota bacterium]
MKILASLCILAALLCGCSKQAASEVAPIRVAVASGFVPALQAVSAVFEARNGAKIEFVAGATGKLAQRIRAGEAFDLILSDDHATVVYLTREKRVIADSAGCWARGPLALYGPRVDAKDAAPMLKAGEFLKLAVADPDICPFGIAARETLDDLGALKPFEERLVKADDVAQALALVDAKTTDLAVVCYGQVAARKDGHAWVVPEHLHAELAGDVGVVQREGAHPRARELRDFLLGKEAQELIEKAGYRRGTR